MAARVFGLVGLSVILTVGHSSVAMCLPDPTPLPYVANGPVDAIAHAGGLTYLGGEFTEIGPRTGRLATVNAGSGRLEQSFPSMQGWVETMASDGSGGYYVGGFITSIAGQPVMNAAHILANGTLDPGWRPGANGDVSDIVVSGGTVYLAGGFTSITDASGSGLVARPGLAAVDTVYGRDTGWNPDPNGPVLAVAVFDSKVYLGGQFTSITNSDGSGTVTRNHAAAVDPAHGYDTGWNPDPSSYVDALAAAGGLIYMGGGFASITDSAGSGSVAREGAAACRPGEWLRRRLEPQPGWRGRRHRYRWLDGVSLGIVQLCREWLRERNPAA